MSPVWSQEGADTPVADQALSSGIRGKIFLYITKFLITTQSLEYHKWIHFRGRASSVCSLYPRDTALGIARLTPPGSLVAVAPSPSVTGKMVPRARTAMLWSLLISCCSLSPHQESLTEV